MVRVAHTHQLDPGTLRAARALLEDVFAGDFTDADWDHALGGVHALAYGGDELVGHASVVQRRLLHRGRALRCGYVEGLGVRADVRRCGTGRALMLALHAVIAGAYELGALGSTGEAMPFYAGLGWQVWRGPLSALTPDGVVATQDAAGGILVLSGAAELDLDAELACDWRDGDVW